VANHLIKITKATRLMGCESTISGVSPAIAQTIVDLGIDVGKIKTTANMKAALANAFEKLGLEIRAIQ
jgi:rsbT co-antagonist protein RsbR